MVVSSVGVVSGAGSCAPSVEAGRDRIAGQFASGVTTRATAAFFRMASLRCQWEVEAGLSSDFLVAISDRNHSEERT